MRQNPRLMAQTKMKQAGAWWDVFDRSVHEFRVTAMRYLQRKHLVEMSGGVRAQKALDESNDWMLTLKDNIKTAARLAGSFESAARVYWEEAEGLELFLARENQLETE